MATGSEGPSHTLLTEAHALLSPDRVIPWVTAMTAYALPLLVANAWSIVANELLAKRKLRPQTQNPKKLCFANELLGYYPTTHTT